MKNKAQNRLEFRDKSIQKIINNQKGSSRLEIWDSQKEWLGLRVTDKGTASFIMFYRPKAGIHKGKLTRVTLGKYFNTTDNKDPDIKVSPTLLDIKTAREISTWVRNQTIDCGKDPKRDGSLALKLKTIGAKNITKRLTKSDMEILYTAVNIEDNSKMLAILKNGNYYDLKLNEIDYEDYSYTEVITYREAVEEYIEKFTRAKKNNRTWKEIRRILLKDGEKWLDRYITEVTKKDIIDRLDEILAEGKGYSANRFYGNIRTFLKWCKSRDKVIHNPAFEIDEKPWDGEKARKNPWSDDQIKAIWKAADEIGGIQGSYLKVLLLMAQRRIEIAGMKEDELDFKAKTWALPAERAKNKRDHVFPLPPLVERVIKGIPRIKDNQHVFAGIGKDGYIHTGTRLKDKVKEKATKDGKPIVEDFSFHQSRDTFRTGLDSLGIPDHIKIVSMNHTFQDVGNKHYSSYDYLDEQREAFNAWAGYVENLVTPKDVVKLHG